MRILIANRGEIARRIIRTAHRLGHETVAVYGDPDATAAHVAEATMSYRLGPAGLAASYLDVDRLLAAIGDTEADAVHPGYGFLAENTGFAQAVIDAGATWIGPHPEAVRQMGSKIEARRIALAADVPIIPGFDEAQEPADLAAAAEQIGYPVLVKAAAGGGGKGIRIVHEPSEFAEALAQASEEAERNFGDGAMIVERYITRPRHVEVQIIGDRHGHHLHLGTRECSVQRRYQKVLEEAPAPNLPDATRSGLHEAAVTLATAMGYDSAGTVEFIVDDRTGEFFFLEMNTRLQVEHPVTEEVTGLDIVELMIGSAQGEPLPLSQDDVTFTGHAFECRINAENPANDFGPQIGTITELHVPERNSPRSRLRWEAAVREGDAVTPYYDSMIAKLVLWGPTRAETLHDLGTVLAELRIGGLVTTAPFHRWLVAQPPVIDGRVTTRFLDESDVPADPAPGAVWAAEAWSWVPPRDHRSVFHTLGAFRLTPHQPDVPIALLAADGSRFDIKPSEFPSRSTDGDHGWSTFPPERAPGAPARTHTETVTDRHRRTVTVVTDGYPHEFSVLDRSEAWAVDGSAGAASGDLAAPFPGAVTEVCVQAGDTVTAGQKCVVIEAMKMLHTLTAPAAGTVAQVTVAPGDHVTSQQVLVTFEAETEAS